MQTNGACAPLVTYQRPEHISELVEICAGGNARVVAGGTDFYPALPQGQTPKDIVDISRVSGLRGITRSDEGFRIGATTTWSDIVKADLPTAFDALKLAAIEVGSVQIQNAGTIAGNICNASPAADGVPPLLCLDAHVELQSKNGLRRIPLSSFIKGVRQTDLQAGEIVTGILVPSPPEGAGSAFSKLGSRRYLVISICMTAVQVRLDRLGRIDQIAIAVGACSPVAMRLSALEASLVGQRVEDVSIPPSALVDLNPIDDVRGSGAFRLEAVKTQILRTLQMATKR